MLVNKFKLKYGERAQTLIDNEVGKFLNNNRLTEENLKKLDEKIGRVQGQKQHQDDVLSEHRSQKSGASRRSKGSAYSRPKTNQGRRPASKRGDVNMDDAISVKSLSLIHI